MLGKSGLFVLEAADGTAAIEAIRGNSPIDVLLLDVTLPEVPGREILAEAKRSGPSRIGPSDSIVSPRNMPGICERLGL
jgi:CheY-like chemotaxis protein